MLRIALATVARKPGHRGERDISVKTIAQETPGESGQACGDFARVLISFRTRGCGCGQHPAFPAPSFVGGKFVMHTSGELRVAGTKTCIFRPSKLNERRRKR